MPFILLGLAFFCFYIAYFFYKRKRCIYLQRDYSQVIPKNASYEYLHKQEVSCQRELDLASFSKLDSIYFIHGTFVGSDPFQIISLLERLLPRIDKKYFNKLKETSKKGHDFMNKDFGNFSKAHADYINEKLARPHFAESFTWSSGNDHYSRVQGMFDLLDELIQKPVKNKKILLLGHSHAGQIFSLLSQFLNNENFRKKLIEIFDKNDQAKSLHKKIVLLKSYQLDFVTLGTPARYDWKLSRNIRVLHFINHRGDDLLGGEVKGFFNTKDGDYIQQWGVSGSDMLSAVPLQKNINKSLDPILGKGCDLDLLLNNIKKRNRLHSHGHHLFVDYADGSKTPNFLKSFFGHGVYTKLDLLPFHLYYIHKKYYAKK